MLNIISKTKYAYVFSTLLVVLSVVSLFSWGLKLGIDFTGGTLMEVRFEKEYPSGGEIGEILKELNLKSLTIQTTDNNGALLRYTAENDKTNELVIGSLREKYPEVRQMRVDFIDASVSEKIKKNSIYAIFWAIIGIMVYITWVFRKVSKPVASWKYSLGAVIALTHDILITTGVFSILGYYKGIEVGVPFVAALLTILGFSIHDTIVVYDRTRENLLRPAENEKFPKIVNRSLNETLVRSINTSLTTIIVLLAVYIFGGESIKDFSLALIIGITFGTYSSIFIASALLVTAYNFQLKK